MKIRRNYVVLCILAFSIVRLYIEFAERFGYGKHRRGKHGTPNNLIPRFVPDGILDQMENKERWLWIKARVKNLWKLWVDGVRNVSLKHSFSGYQRRQIFVVPGILMTKFATRGSTDAGGPLGDLLMWADLVAGLHVLGHNVTLLDNKHTANSRLMAMTSRSMCSQGSPLIFIDILAVSQLTYTIRRQLNCKFRVLDAYGTEAAYNDPVYSSRHGYISPWGRLALNLKQFYTFYPHSPDNSFLGFVIQKHSNVTNKEDIAVIYGKDPIYITPNHHWKYIEAIARQMTVYATMSKSGRIPSGVHNLGVQTAEAYSQLLDRAKVLFGLGYPFESSGALESLAHGCVFLNPRFTDKDRNVLRSRIYRKPTSRKLTSQVPYMEKAVGAPYVYTVNIRNTSAIEDVLAKVKKSKLKSYVPYEFSVEGYLERLSVYVEKQDFCHCDKRQWPPLVAMVTYLGSPNESCIEVCQNKGVMCEQTFFEFINKPSSFKKYDITCNHTLQESDILPPYYNNTDQSCALQSKQTLFSCSGHSSHIQRLCPCRVYAPEQSYLCEQCF